MAEKRLTNEELAEMLRGGSIGVTEFNDYREENPNQEIDFSDYNFSGLKLAELNLEGPIKLDKTDFAGADLRRASFLGATGFLTSFREADLEEADFTEAIFLGAQCSEARFIHARLDGATFKEAECVATAFDDTSLIVACFEDADLAEASLVNAALEYGVFRGSNILTANFAGAERLDPELRCQLI